MINLRCMAPVSGRVIPIEEVKDSVFSNKTLGEGIAVIPDSNHVCSPIEGILTMVFRTGHAFVVKNKDGIELLIHIGIDTVKYNGKGFNKMHNEGAEVKAGETIIAFDDNLLETADMTTMVIALNKDKINSISCEIAGYCSAGIDCIMTIN